MDSIETFKAQLWEVYEEVESEQETEAEEEQEDGYVVLAGGESFYFYDDQ